MRARQWHYDRLLGRGFLNPPQWRSLTLCLVRELRGPEAASRAADLLDVVFHLGGSMPHLGQLAELCHRQQDSCQPVEFSFTFDHPSLANALVAVASFARPAPEGEAGPGAASDDGYWRKSPTTGKWFFVKKDMRGVAAEPIKPLRRAKQDQGDAPRKPKKIQQLQDKKQRKLKEDATQKSKKPLSDFQKLRVAVKTLLRDGGKKLKQIGATAWDRLKKKLTPEIRALGKKIGVRPGRLKKVPGNSLRALADPSRKPANPLMPLAKRSAVPSLVDKAKAMRGMPVSKAITTVIPQKDSVSARTPVPSTNDRYMQVAHELSNKIRSLFDSLNGKPPSTQTQQAIAKAVSGLSHAAAMHVYERVVDTADRGRLPAPASSRQVAAAIDHAIGRGWLSRMQPSGQIASRISGDVHSAILAESLVDHAGARHAELSHQSQRVAHQAGQVADEIDATSSIRFLRHRQMATQLSDLQDRNLQIAAEQNKIATGAREAVARSLELSDAPAASLRRVPSKGDGSIHQSQSQKIDDVMQWLGRSLRNGTVNVTFQRSETNRSHAKMNRDAVKTMAIHLSQGADHATIIHEIGHAIETQVPGVHEAAKEFLQYRCGGEKVRDMGEVGGMPGEMGRKDSFDRHFKDGLDAHYVGRHYKTKATEIVSMGLQEMYRDPVGFARNDPEYFRFMHGILSGETRKK